MSHTDHNYLETQSRPFIRRFKEASLRVKEKRSKEQAKQNLQKISSHTPDSDVKPAPVAPTSSVPSAKQFDEEKYRATIINKMIALIAKHKSITA